jgi:hypothetical protein
MKALRISVFRSNGRDCTNGGISSKYNELLLICDDGYINIDENNIPENAVKMVKRNLFGKVMYHIEPYNKPTEIGWMMGGNFAYTCDSRFSEMCDCYNAIPIHDRQESQELNDLLSR